MEYAVQAPRPTPIYMHHCAFDRAVSMQGCCSSSPCCCGIGAGDQVCVPTTKLYELWLALNMCSGAEQMPGPANSQCTVGLGCKASHLLQPLGSGVGPGGESHALLSFPV